VSARRRWILAGAIAALAGGGGVAWRQRQESDAAATQGLWDRRLVQPDGAELAMGSLRGRPLVINFWATWCAPCIKEMPELDRFHREFGPRGWQVLGVAIDRREPVLEFLRLRPVSFPVALAALEGTELARQLGNPSGSLPFTVVVDAAGRLVQRKLGQTSFDELARWAGRA
jgi:thiol-disulfide isomerase/thioredoxin